jgi:predicted component of viral defense system (DUF524 family)
MMRISKVKAAANSADYYSISNFMDYEIQINSIQSINSQDLSKDERLYRDFVYNTYLSVPEDFPAAMSFLMTDIKRALKLSLKRYMAVMHSFCIIYGM